LPYFPKTGIADAIVMVKQIAKPNNREDAMKTILETNKLTDTDIKHETSIVLMTVFSVSALLIGLWAFACVVGGLFNHGLVAMVRGYITAITGY